MIPSYASSPVFDAIGEYLEYIEQARAAGYRAVKFHTRGALEWDLEMVRVVRARFGDSGMGFMLDLEGVYTVEEALIMGSELSAAGYEWFEAPIDDTDLDGYRRLCRETDVPIISSGNAIIDPATILHALATGCWSRLRTDPGVVGGVSAARRVMALAGAYSLPIELQSYGYPLSQAVNLHLMMTDEACTYFEAPFPREDFDYAAFSPIRIDAEGLVHAPDRPGLGVDPDWARIEADAFLVFEAG
jgi:L-alanine-DL-glutamate epimerase-like enolase superfamily enzyme